MSDTYVCPKHERALRKGFEYCALCVDWLASQPVAEKMTPAERADEMDEWIRIRVLTVPFEDLHERIEELAGRPVFTHELAHPERIAEQIRRSGVSTTSIGHAYP